MQRSRSNDGNSRLSKLLTQNDFMEGNVMILCFKENYPAFSRETFRNICIIWRDEKINKIL
jgi:hypothetical protein